MLGIGCQFMINFMYVMNTGFILIKNTVQRALTQTTEGQRLRHPILQRILLLIRPKSEPGQLQTN